jgi:hypothetical protein
MNIALIFKILIAVDEFSGNSAVKQDWDVCCIMPSVLKNIRGKCQLVRWLVLEQ